jgi:oxygen-independent coproporphyrinogen-3 oxidase
MMRFSYTRVGAARVHDEEQEKETLRCVEASGQARGYVRSSVWTFNRDPDLRYTSITREFYLGLGPSGSSFLDGRFTVNTFDADTYCDLVDRGLLPVVLSGGMDRRLASAYYLFWRLYEGRVDRPRFRSLFGVPVEQEFPWFVGALLIGGFLKRHGDSYRLTPAGLDLYHTLERWVTYRYIEPLWAACRASPFPSSLRL